MMGGMVPRERWMDDDEQSSFMCSCIKEGMRQSQATPATAMFDYVSAYIMGGIEGRSGRTALTRCGFSIAG